MDRLLFDQLTGSDYAKIRSQMVADLEKYYQDLQIAVTEGDYKLLLPENRKSAVQGKTLTPAEVLRLSAMKVQKYQMKPANGCMKKMFSNLTIQIMLLS
jgi:hypothetical protein